MSFILPDDLKTNQRPKKMKENQPAKQDPSLEAIFKWMCVALVHGATNFIIALSRAKHNPSV